MARELYEIGGLSRTLIGQMCKRVSIIGMQEVDDGHGGFIEQEVTIASRICAAVQPLTGRDLQYAQQIEPRASFLVRIWYRPDVSSAETLMYHDDRRGDRRFEIVAPPLDPDEQHWELQLLCREADVAP